jgi:hypothetical protein
LSEEAPIITVYLGACCLNRPFDDQTQERIRLESEAVLLILTRAEAGGLRWVGSEVLEYEIAQTPDPERRGRVLLLAAAAQVTVALGPAEEARGRHLEALGFRPFDALHIACAEGGRASLLLTTDDRFLRTALRSATELRTRVENPLTWLQEVGKP